MNIHDGLCVAQRFLVLSRSSCATNTSGALKQADFVAAVDEINDRPVGLCRILGIESSSFEIGGMDDIFSPALSVTSFPPRSWSAWGLSGEGLGAARLG